MENLKDISTADLVDMHGALTAAGKKLEDRRSKISEELVRRKAGNCDGAAYHCTFIAATVQWKMQRDGILRDMGEAWLQKYLKPSTVKAHIKTTPLAPAVSDQLASILLAAE
jgi:hypothetical protein